MSTASRERFLFAVIGIFIGVAVAFILVSRPTPPSITVAQPTVIVDTDSEEAINNQTAQLSRFYEGVYETVIAEEVEIQLNELGAVLREDLRTAVAEQTDRIEANVIERISPSTHYSGGVTNTPTPDCLMINGC